MLNARSTRRLSFTNPWERARVQLLGGILVAVLVPHIAMATVTPRLAGSELYFISLTAGISAIGLGYYVFRGLVVFPGIRASYYIIPTFGGTFGLTLAVLLIFRLEYSRPLLISGFVLCVSWYYVVYSRIQRRRELCIGIVPVGDIDTIRSIPTVDWLMLCHVPGGELPCDAIVADFRADLPAEWEGFLADAALEGVAVYDVKQLRDSLTGRVEISHFSEHAGGLLSPDAAYQKAKALIDFSFAVILVLPIGLVLLLLAILIKIDSTGPVFFRQERIGFRGRPFCIWKLRTMRIVDNSPSEKRASVITITDDERITKIGRALRRARLDELPQIINILAGDMSWIGPRPEAVMLSHWYQDEIPFYRYRHVVRPGITGWAQVNLGHVSNVEDVTGKLHYDFYYIANFSLWIDVLIAVRTLRTMATGFGAK